MAFSVKRFDTVVQGAELTLQESVTIPVAIGGLQVPWNAVSLVNQNQIDDYLADNSATAFAHPQDALNVLPSTLAANVDIVCEAGTYPTPPTSARPSLYASTALLVIPHFRFADAGLDSDGVQIIISGPGAAQWTPVDPVLENVTFSIGAAAPNLGTTFDFTPEAADLLMGFDLLGTFLRDDDSNEVHPIQRVLSDDVLEVNAPSLNPSGTVSIVEPASVIVNQSNSFLMLQLGNSGRGQVVFQDWRFNDENAGRVVFQYGGNIAFERCQLDTSGISNSGSHNDAYMIQGLERKQLGLQIVFRDCAARSNPNNRLGPVIQDSEASDFQAFNTVFYNFGGSAYLRAGLASMLGAVFNNCGALDGVKPTNYGAGSGSSGLERITAALAVDSVLFRPQRFDSTTEMMICASPGVGLFWSQAQLAIFDNSGRMVFVDNAGPAIAVADASALPLGSAGELEVSGTGNDVGIEFRGNNSVVSFASDITVTGTNGDVRDRDGLVTSYASVAEGTAVIDTRNNVLERVVETGVSTGNPR